MLNKSDVNSGLAGLAFTNMLRRCAHCLTMLVQILEKENMIITQSCRSLLHQMMPDR